MNLEKIFCFEIFMFFQNVSLMLNFTQRFLLRESIKVLALLLFFLEKNGNDTTSDSDAQ
jgi:hypothetical protein